MNLKDYFDATDENENFTMTLDDPNDFLISLSAIASTKTIVGYSTLPTDTMFILDVSGSMDSGNRDVRMVQAANKAIGDLLALNNYNRVGVVLYSSNATLMMPLDRYTTTSTTTVSITTDRVPVTATAVVTTTATTSTAVTTAVVTATTVLSCTPPPALLPPPSPPPSCCSCQAN